MQVGIGQINRLKVLRRVSVGAYLDGETLGDILLPNRYLSDAIVEGDEVEVFVYLDSEDRLIATTETPLAKVGDFAFMRVVATSKFGAFLDWGLMKDLLVPFREQAVKMEKDRWYVVYVYLDHETGRIVASAKINKFLDNVSPQYQQGDEVDLLIAAHTDLGYKAVINNLHSGLLYNNQIFRKLNIGQQLKGYINKIREDDKIDLLLEKPGYDKTASLSEQVLSVIKEAGGFMDVTDKSDPERIVQLFGMSKKNFKMALGALYREHIVSLEKDGVRIL
ncbi:CvfB family protein [Geofilum sp. OHC36d9]|uniref:CvfB family protein n=1 Tax=Geofilum sp. OHC36d9 TaxID=3458413 RepID=UPI00403466C2